MHVSLHKKISRGMTLAEILVAVSILVIVMVAVATFQFNVMNYNRTEQVRLTNAHEAQNILKFMSKELRAMAISANGSYAILSAGTSTITFYVDVDGNGSQEQVRYYVASTTMYRGVTPPTGSPAVYNPANETMKILVTGVRNAPTFPAFEYFGSTYDGTTAAMTYPLVLTSIRLVKINMNIDSDPNKSPIPKIFSTQVSLRNLKDNL